MEFEIKEDSIASTVKEQTLYTCCFVPTGAVKAQLVIVHGLGEYCRRYDEIAAMFAQEGVQVLMYDHRGCGKSQGPRDRNSFGGMCADLDLVLNLPHPDVPRFLYGHSMGGQLVLGYVTLYEKRTALPLKAVISSSPYLKSGKELPAVKLFFGRMLSSLMPDFLIDAEITHSELSRDPVQIEKTKADTVMSQKASLRLANDLITTGEKLSSAGPKFDKAVGVESLLMLHGTGDKICSQPASEAFFNSVALEDKLYYKLADMVHECHNDIGKELVREILKTWVLSCLQGDARKTGIVECNATQTPPTASTTPATATDTTAAVSTAEDVEH